MFASIYMLEDSNASLILDYADFFFIQNYRRQTRATTTPNRASNAFSALKTCLKVPVIPVGFKNSKHDAGLEPVRQTTPFVQSLIPLRTMAIELLQVMGAVSRRLSDALGSL